MKRKKNKIFWPSGVGIWTPDFWTNSRPKFEFWGRLDLSSPGFLELLDFIDLATLPGYVHARTQVGISPVHFPTWRPSSVVSLQVITGWPSIIKPDLQWNFTNLPTLRMPSTLIKPFSGAKGLAAKLKDKSQLISERNFGVFKSPQKSNQILKGFLP